MSSKSSGPPVLLASSSPRRKSLLAQLIPNFDVASFDVAEDFEPGTPPNEVVQALARRKLEAVPDTCTYAYTIAADTVVVAPSGEILGKPANRAEAAEFLAMLSGSRHEVLTGVSLGVRSISDFGHAPREQAGAPFDTVTVAYERTFVEVARLEQHDIEWYLATDEWHGVAGGYRMQSAGSALLTAVNGSPSNVIGLPMRLVYSMLSTHRFPFR